MMNRGTPPISGHLHMDSMMNRLLQERLYGTLEKSSGCCLVRHNEVLALKAEAGRVKDGAGGVGMGYPLVN